MYVIFVLGNIFLLITLPLNEHRVDNNQTKHSLRSSNAKYETGTSWKMKNESETMAASTISPHQKYIMERLTEQDEKEKNRTDNRVSDDLVARYRNTMLRAVIFTAVPHT
jgi:hypothetical protein